MTHCISLPEQKRSQVVIYPLKPNCRLPHFRNVTIVVFFHEKNIEAGPRCHSWLFPTRVIMPSIIILSVESAGDSIPRPRQQSSVSHYASHVHDLQSLIKLYTLKNASSSFLFLGSCCIANRTFGNAAFRSKKSSIVDHVTVRQS
jgi:hypothetical protein